VGRDVPGHLAVDATVGWGQQLSTARPHLEIQGSAHEQLEGLPATVLEALTLRSSFPEASFVIGEDFDLTFGEADKRSANLAARLLAAGVGKGSRIGTLFANSPEWVISWLAAARIGAITVPLSTFSTGYELNKILRHTDVAALLTMSVVMGEDVVSKLEDALPGLASSTPDLAFEAAPYLRWIHVEGPQPPPWASPMTKALDRSVVSAAEAEVVPADALVMVTTSGTTAGPKSVIHTHGSLLRHSALLTQLRRIEHSDRLYCPMPFFWVGGLTTSLLYGLTCGCAIVTQERFEPAGALDLMERERVTLVQVWPNAARTLAEHPSFPRRDLSSVRGGTLPEALPDHLRPEAPDLYAGLFGMTETGGPHSNPEYPYSPLPYERRGTFGHGVSGIERRVMDPKTGETLEHGEIGELHVRGPFVMEQIYKRERHRTFNKDGWYATGDTCSIDEWGLLRFHGRRSPMIKTGGSNVAPREVEEVLACSPDVDAVYVLGVAAGVRGQDVAAVVVPSQDADPDASSLATFVRQRLAAFKVPRRWLIIDLASLPVLPTGKVDMQALRGFFDVESGSPTSPTSQIGAPVNS
jgi:acyl-CoA synthetase (AMP-forming)/AMP-acid ligase II